jgi:hypothetical protein
VADVDGMSLTLTQLKLENDNREVVAGSEVRPDVYLTNGRAIMNATVVNVDTVLKIVEFRSGKPERIHLVRIGDISEIVRD